MDTRFEILPAVICFEHIPSQAQELPRWALYTDKKNPIKLSAVARGWPADGWNNELTGDAAKAGARSNDPNTWGTFEDCYRVWQIAKERGASFIVGPAFALTEEIGITVIDQDDPVAKAANKVWKSAEAKALAIEEAFRHQDIILKMFAGHYIERSMSGRGFHIFVKGKLPHARYNFSFYGSVFGCCQFLNMTGDVF